MLTPHCNHMNRRGFFRIAGVATAVGLLGWVAGEGRTMHDLDLDTEQPRGLLRRAVDFLRNRL